jgi:hypothetical protein
MSWAESDAAFPMAAAVALDLIQRDEVLEIVVHADDLALSVGVRTPA